MHIRLSKFSNEMHNL